MKIILALFLSLIAFDGAWASTIPVTPPPNIGSVAGGWATVGRTVVNGGAATIEMEARMAGIVAEIPAVARIGSTAASVGLAAIRLNPVGLATSAIAQYVLQAGIQACFQPGGWCVPASSPSSGDPGFDGWAYNAAGNLFPSPTAACLSMLPAGNVSFNSVQLVSPGQYNCIWNNLNSGGTFASGGTNKVGTCVSGYVVSGSSCVPGPSMPQQVASDADWAKLASLSVPDQVVTDLSAAQVPLPVTITPSPAPVTVNLSSPYVDPVTGTTFRDVGVITPNADGKTATLNVVKQPVDASGNPQTVTNASGVQVNVAPQKQDDPCTGHETRMGCAEEGAVPQAPDLKENKINVAIAPDGGWGADNASCPSGAFSVRGFSFAVPWTPVCSFASMIRPLIIAMAWLAAAFIVVGAKQGGGE